MSKQPELTNEQRRIIYQARRGLKELDFYINPYVREHYLTADKKEQQAFATLLTYEDPDLLNFFMNQDSPDEPEVAEMVERLKTLQRGEDVND